MNKKENYSKNLRKDGPTYFRERNNYSRRMPLNRNPSYPLPAGPDGERRQQYILSQNIDGYNKVPGSYTGIFDNSIGSNSRNLYARGNTSGSYGADTSSYVHKKRSFTADGSTMTNMTARATVSGGQDMVVKVFGNNMTVTVPPGVSAGQTFTFKVPVKRQNYKTNRTAAAKSGYDDASVGSEWGDSGYTRSLASTGDFSQEFGENKTPMSQYVKPMINSTA